MLTLPVYLHLSILLLQVAVATNAAFDIVRTYEEDIPAIKPLLKHYPTAIAGLFSRNPFQAASIGFSMGSNRHTPVYWSLAMDMDLSELTFANAVYLLNSYKSLLASVLFPNAKSIAHNISSIVPPVRPTAKTPATLADEDELNLLFFSEEQFSYVKQLDTDGDVLAKLYGVIVDQELPLVTTDHFSHDFFTQKLIGSEPVSLFQAFGAQIHFDICSVLNSKITKGYDDLLEACKSMRDSINLFKKQPRNATLEQRKTFKMILSIHIPVFEGWIDAIIKDRDEFRKGLKYRQGRYTESALERNPLLCGV